TDEHLVAGLDMGTNSVRLLLVRMFPNHSFTVVAEQKETVRLGEGEFKSNRLQPEAMRRASLVCSKFAEIARSRGADQIVAVATSATREAENRAVFLRHLRRVAGIDVRVISGKE
ncbi:MAG: Ppx/GppA family phosphatase, partial [Planctomycetota bacterium]|nr:Ppx/GppA family phosphatase [Planctomycetota bacterium]